MITTVNKQGITILTPAVGKYLVKGEAYTDGVVYLGKADKPENWVEQDAKPPDPPEPLADYIEKWGAVDATVEGASVGEEATVTVTQDANGTHFAFVLPYIPI